MVQPVVCTQFTVSSVYQSEPSQPVISLKAVLIDGYFCRLSAIKYIPASQIKIK